MDDKILHLYFLSPFLCPSKEALLVLLYIYILKILLPSEAAGSSLVFLGWFFFFVFNSFFCCCYPLERKKPQGFPSSLNKCQIKHSKQLFKLVISSETSFL